MWQVEIFVVGLCADLLTGRVFVPSYRHELLWSGADYAYMCRSYDDRPELLSLISAVDGVLPRSVVVHGGRHPHARH